MRRYRLRATTTLLACITLVAIAEACESFSDATPPAADAASDPASDAAAAADAASVDGTTVGPATDGGAAGACTPACPGSAVCDDGTCVVTMCSGDGGTVLLRPKSLVNSTGSLKTMPSSASILDTLRERGDGDGDQTRVEAQVADAGAFLKLQSELFTLPANREIESVYIRARSRLSDAAGSASIGLVYFHTVNNSVLYQNPPTAVGTGYDIANFYLKAPYLIAPNATWTEANVNGTQIGVQMNGAAGNAEAAVYLTQVWLEVCLTAK